MDADEDADGGKMKTEDELARVTETIIGCAFRVINTLGTGFLEKVYENALAHELRKLDMPFAQQVPVRVLYEGVVVGDYIPDLVVDREVIVELKVARAIDSAHVAQCLNALRATGYRVGLVLNFGHPRLQVKRVVHHL